MRRILMGLAALTSITLVGVAASPAALAKTHRNAADSGAIYDSIVDPNPGNLPSVGFEATQGYELGNQIDLSGVGRVLDNVEVQMSSWGCQSGTWSGDNCATTPGATFSEPITVNIYDAPSQGESAPTGTKITPGALIGSSTQTFAIPYRPSADPNYITDCASDAAAQDVPVSDFDGTWYDSAIDPTTGDPYGCLNGFIDNIDLTFGHVNLPSSVVYGIEYPTSDYGYPAYGDSTACHATAQGCGYDGLNIGLSSEPASPSIGTDPNPGTIYWDTTYAGNYCDSGTAGVGVFRLDSPGSGNNCWAPYIPAVEFNAVANAAATITSPDSANVVAGTAFSFTVTTDGVPTPTVSKGLGRLPAGLSFVSNANGTATISGTALTHNRDGAYNIVIRAVNGAHMRSKQVLTLTLTGGRS